MNLKRSAMFFAFLILIPTTMALGESTEKDVEEFLQKEIVDNIFLIKNFYEGNNLRFDSQGELVSKNSPGIWTVSGFFQPKKVKLSKAGITLTGERFYWTYDQELHEQQLMRIPGNTKIDIKRQPEQNDVLAIRELMFRIFLLPNESLVEHVPIYWQNIVRNKFKIAPPAPPEKPWPLITDLPILLQPIPHPSPEYRAKARSLGLTGQVALRGIVDVHGSIKITEIVIPLGAGLEEIAIQDVEKAWRFRPALDRSDAPIEASTTVIIGFSLAPPGKVPMNSGPGSGRTGR